MFSVRTHRASRWSAPLLLTLLATACGGSDGGGSPGNGGNDAAPPPPVGTLLNSVSCELKYYAREAPAVRTGSDPRIHRLWHLSNTGSLPNTVAGEDLRMGNLLGSARGEGIRVAIIDDALDVTHEDLLPNIVRNGSFNYNVRGDWKRGTAYPLPCARDNTHGTEVGGIIAARDNNGIGVAGVAPRASLVGYNALASNMDKDVLDAFTRANDRNHIYNNSWGADDIGHFFSPLPSPAAHKAAVETGLRTGRNGLGSIYIFAGGNGAHVSDYSGYDGTVSLYGTLAVCAVNATGKRARYSEPGSNLLVCAPSGNLNEENDPAAPPAIDTTVPQNTYSDNSFNGTSASAPMVSGVAALVLQANPNLSWRDMRLVLARSARQVDPTDPGWTRFGDYRFNHKYGFGAVDAQAAVTLARNWQSVGNSTTVKQCGPYTQTVNTAIPENNLLTVDDTYITQMYDQLPLHQPASGGLSSKISVPAACDISKIEHVEVRMKVRNAAGADEHPDSGNLHVSLTSPSGQTSTLAVPHRCTEPDNGTPIGCTGLDDFTFGISRHLDEPTATPTTRDWTLNIVDRVQQNQGSLASWELTFYGR